MKGKDSSTASILQQVYTICQQVQLYAIKPKQQTTYITMHGKIACIAHQQPIRTVHQEYTAHKQTPQFTRHQSITISLAPHATKGCFWQFLLHYSFWAAATVGCRHAC